MKTTWGRLASLSLVVFATGTLHASTYYLQSMGGTTSSPPFPNDPYDGAEPISTVDAAREIYLVQDNTNDWEMLTTAKQLDAMSASSTTMTTSDSTSPPSPGDGGTNTSGSTNYTVNALSTPLLVGSNDLWIELLQIDPLNQQVQLRLHNTQAAESYQLLSTNALTTNGLIWTLGEIITGASDTNYTDFDWFSFGTNSQMFFRAHHADPITAVTAQQEAISPNPTTGDPGQPGIFHVFSELSLTNDLTVYYSTGGTASNGVDYSSLNGVVTIPAASDPNNPYTNVYVYPTANNRMQGDKTVTLSLLQTNDYLIDPYNSSASISIQDSYTLISLSASPTNAYRPGGPPGIPAQAATFHFSRIDHQGIYPPITVAYQISGTASNGVDYSFLSNTLVFSNQALNVDLDVTPLAESILQGAKTVTLTLIPTNGYFVDTNNASQTIQILDTSTTVSIRWVQDAIETNSTGVGQPGIFEVDRFDDRNDYPPMTVNYRISGTAQNGVDYQTLSGTVTFADTAQSTDVFINTIEQDLIEPDETVVLTLVTNGNAYFIDPNNASTNLIIHTTVGFFNAANISTPVGLDYFAPSNCLVASYNMGSGSAFNLARIYTNITSSGGVPVTNVVVTNWSGISGLFDEVKIATVKTPAGVLTNSAGFTNGDLFFGNNTEVGWLSADGTRSNLDWCILTNATVANALPLRGSICIDQTGTFSNQIIVVTSPNDGTADPKGVWRIDAKGHPTLLTNLATSHLEGVTTLTNDVQRWGPWAGKIITGDDQFIDPNTFQPAPRIFTIASNGAVSTYFTTNFFPGGIYPEDFDVIPTNAPLYLTQFDAGTIMEVPAAYFRNYVGDLLITQDGESPDPGVAFFIVHWNAQGSNFVTTQIPLPPGVGHVEHVTFAPIQFPKQ